MTIIHAWIFDPTRPSLFKRKANEKSALFTLHCDRASDCDVYTECNSCLLTTAMRPCKYGRKQCRGGHTRRAQKFSRQILDWQKEYSEYLGNLSSLQAYNRIFKIADHWYLPYSHMTKEVWGRGFPLESKWVPAADMTSDLLSRILSARPMAEFGGEIKKYQEEEIPKFLTDVRANYPDLWALVPDDQKARLEGISHIGRKAILSTCLAGSFGDWYWNGEHLSGRGNSLMPIKGQVRITPDEGVFLKVTDDNTVGPETRFVD